MSSGSVSAKVLPIAKAHTALAKKVPKPPKTGNKSKDEEANSRRELMMDLISHMQWDGSHILPLYGTLKKRLAESGKPVGEDYFTEVSIVQKLDAAWMEAWVVTNSDFSVEELALAKDADEDAIIYLFIYGCQYQLNLKLSSMCLHKPLMTRMANERHVACGNRLSGLKGKLGWKAESPLVKFKNWGCYKLDFNKENQLSAVTHCATATVKKIGEAHRFITKENTRLINNHSDHDACLRMPVVPDIPVVDFFADKEGPKSYMHYGGGVSKDFNQACKVVEKAIEAEACRPNASILEEVRASNAAASSARSKAVTAKAREQAKLRSDSKRLRREITLD